MKKHMPSTRRNFIQKTALSSLAIPASRLSSADQRPTPPKLPREVWVATIGLDGVRAANPIAKRDIVVKFIDQLRSYQPDIICLPETFAFTQNDEPFTLNELTEGLVREILQPLQNFAKSHRCYLICPSYAIRAGKKYISAALINRVGGIQGTYFKIHPTIGEMDAGITPGPLDPPIFETDFGKIGIQICFDVKWYDGWKKLKEKGAEIIFWPSAYASGREIGSRAWLHQYYVVTSTLKDTSAIFDMTGQVLAKTDRWQRHAVCTAINLEKVFVHAWPAAQKYPEIMRKYGRKVHIESFGEEEWTTIESLDAGLRVADILREFGLQTHHDMISAATLAQAKKRSL